MDNEQTTTQIADEESLLLALLHGNVVPTYEEVRQLAEKYPFFTLPALRCLENSDSLSTEQRTWLQRQVAINAPDPYTLFRLTDSDGATLCRFYPPEEGPATPTTDSAIDTFLETYGNIDPQEQALLERLIFNPVPDYSSVLEREQAADGQATEETDKKPTTDEESSSQDALLAAFVKRQTPAAPVPPASAPREGSKPTAAPDSTLSESLAKIYIRRGRYDKAYEMISNLSHNFPDRSKYYADQLRFLQKLIINANHKE